MPNPISQPGSDQEWEALLQQLRKQPRAQPRPFFYARVQARLTAQLPPRGWWLPDWARRPAYVALLGMLILAVSGDGAALRPAMATNQPASSSPH
ncbi:hypothetical protein [Hymenobacter sp. BT559]|uniref:hypothetical protein n=1 Tax=Hymenobacter sp. BT559 TaxID=2795729 RepID=UPI0018EAAB95|nr:hypothetical protein [Hymenobacter sp. BT559]MBJ6143850.1 hypothetical protein [Hymenobacter sp. BT559]